jgi:hypothetical protein
LDLLIDSCSYFRLAQSLHPILGNPSRLSNYNILIHLSFHNEFNNNSDLTTQFHWANQPEFISNRGNSCISLPSDREIELMRAVTSINAEKRRSHSNISKVDIFALSSAYVLNIPLITDDLDMEAMAKEFEIECMNSMEFLNYWHSNRAIDDAKLLELFEYWEYSNDCPAGYKLDRGRYFSHLSNTSLSPL